MISLETRAEIIADCSGGRTRGTSKWMKLRNRALEELQAAVAAAKDDWIAEQPLSAGDEDSLMGGR